MAESQAETDRTPSPVLTYNAWSRDWQPDPMGIVGEPGSPRLFSVDNVTAWLWAEGLRVTVTGPARKRDGGRGQHRRSVVVDLGQQQPDWLAFLVRDVRRRLSTRPGDAR